MISLKRLIRRLKRKRKPLWTFNTRDRIAYKALFISRFNLVAVLLNAVVASVAIASLYLNFRTAAETREAARSQTKLNQQLADAATKQAEASIKTAAAAKLSADISEKALRITQRAYFSVLLPKISGFEHGGAPKASLYVKNVGATPGYEVTLKTFIGLLPTNSLPDSVTLSDKVDGAVVASTVARDEALGGAVTMKSPLSEEEYKRIDEADARIIVHAILGFDDAFGCKIQRKVCFLFNGATIRNGEPEVCGGDRNDEKYVGECSHQ
jgi:hypothetical protein